MQICLILFTFKITFCDCKFRKIKDNVTVFFNKIITLNC